jgi:hypothetical protein
LIDSIKSVREVIQDIIAEAEGIIKERLPSLLHQSEEVTTLSGDKKTA